MKKVLVLVGVILVASFAVRATAATLMTGDSVSVSAAHADNLYVAGGNVSVSQAAAKDVYGAGGQVAIDTSVGGDVVAAGGSVSVNGDVAGDIRVAGGNIAITKSVGGDLVIGAGTVSVSHDTTVGGDLIIGAGTLIFNGTVIGNAKIRGGDVTINGVINGNADIRADRITLNGEIKGTSKLVGEITLVSGAKLDGAVEYWRPDGEMSFGTAVATGTPVFNPGLAYTKHGEQGKDAFAGFIFAWLAFSFMSSLLLMLIFFGFGYSVFEKALPKLKTKFWKYCGFGFVYLIVMPVIVLVAFISLIGWPIGVLGAAVYLFSIVSLKAVAAIMYAMCIKDYFKWKGGKVMLFLLSVVVLILLRILSLLPLFGWIAVALLLAAPWGALIMTKKEMYKKIME